MRNAWSPWWGYAIRGEDLWPKNPRALREVERLSRNPEKLASAGGRCWKDAFGRKRSFKTHAPASLPNQERIGHRLARDQETLTRRNLDGQCQGRPGENYQELPGLVKRPKTKKHRCKKTLTLRIK